MTGVSRANVIVIHLVLLFHECVFSEHKLLASGATLVSSAWI